MSVYFKEKPEYLKEAIGSMLHQTVAPAEFIVVCDGPLTPALDAVLQAYGDKLILVRLPENKGLGNALDEGLKRCSNELIARMDSDDVSIGDRCERQLKAFERNPDLDIISGTVAEFDESGETVSLKTLPCDNNDIYRYSKKRCPFNHPAVMYKKSTVLKAGGYNSEYPLFEDYDLWIRLLKNGCAAENLSDTLVRMRIDRNLYKRRGGRKYAATMLRFHRHLKKSGWTTAADFLTGAVPHAVVCILPNPCRKGIYKTLRK